MSEHYIIKKSPTRRWLFYKYSGMGRLTPLPTYYRPSFTTRQAKELASTLLEQGHTVDTPNEWGEQPEDSTMKPNKKGN